MQIVAWHDWLDRHIPYYAVEKQQSRYLDNPPAVVLVVDPVDRSRRKNHLGFVWNTWESMNTDIQNLGYKFSPIFLDNDTHQRWYWAFWNEQEALITVLKLS